MADDSSSESGGNENNQSNRDPIMSALGGALGETIKKVFAAGVTAAFLTEESIRNYLSEIKLPKEFLQLLLQGASKSKDELTQKVSKEIGVLLSKVDFVKEVSRFAETHKFKVTAEIEILKKDKTSNELKKDVKTASESKDE